MRVLFCHDGPLHVDENNNYYGIAHNDEMFKRYYNIADKISVLIRLKKVDQDIKKNLSQITLSPFEVIEVPNLSSIKGILINRGKAKKIIKNAVLKSDYIVARLPSMNGFIAIDYAEKFNKPYLTEVVACPWDAYWNHSFKGRIIAPFMYNATKKRVRESNYVIYVTNEFLQKRYPTKGENVNCSNVSLNKFEEKILENRLIKIKNKNLKEKIIIGTTAAVDVKYKGQQYVIKALGKLKKQGFTNYEYQLVGSGDQTYLMSIAEKYNVSDQVKFVGPLPHSKVFEWLDTIDIYVQPSRQEGLPRALIEAMSRGVPAIGANTAGIPELIDSECIFSNNRNNVDEIISIMKFFREKENLLQQSVRNYNEAKKYSNDIIENLRVEFFNFFKTDK